MSISIEKANLDQVAETIFDLVKRTFVRNFDLPTRDVGVVKTYLHDCEVYLVKDGKTPIGYFGYQLEPNTTVELKSIALLPSHQKMGIGKEMLDKIFELTKGNNIWLVVHPHNSSALIIYLKNDFIVAGWKENFFGDGEPRLLMERKNV